MLSNININVMVGQQECVGIKKLSDDFVDEIPSRTPTRIQSVLTRQDSIF
jgi:hypothetical protein